MLRQLSSFDINVLTHELQKTINCVVEKIYQINRDDILIKIKNLENREKESIFIRNARFVALTKKEIQTPKRPSTFAMTLRKYLINGRITEIHQHEFDRIIMINIRKKDDIFTLILEFFADGNIILTGKNNKIILPLIHQSWAHRTLKGRRDYIPPPSQINPFKLSIEELENIISKSKSDIVRTLAVNINLSGIIAEEICNIANIDKNKGTDKIDKDEIKKIYKALNHFLIPFKEKKFNPVLVIKNNEIIDILPFEFHSYKEIEYRKIDTISKGLEHFIKIKKQEEEIKQVKQDKIESELGKLNRQLIQQQSSIKKFEEKISQKKIEGDLIYLNYQKLETLLIRIAKVLESKEKKELIEQINKEELVETFKPEKNTLIVKLKDIKGKEHSVKIDFRKTVSENAEEAYKQNKKQSSKLRGAEKSLKETMEKIKTVKQQKQKDIKPVEEEKNIGKNQKRYWFEQYRWFISSEGNLVIAGKDAKTNERIVKKYLKSGDRYVHADIQGAPSVIVKNKDLNNKNQEITEETLNEACIFAASYSKAWKQFAEAQAYWVNPEQVSKTPQSGEFVPKGAFIIRGKRNYNRCKLELAIGHIKIDEFENIMCGPVKSIKKRTDKYIIFQPGAIKKSNLAHEIAKDINVSVDSVEKILPPGGGIITEKKGISKQ